MQTAKARTAEYKTHSLPRCGLVSADRSETGIRYRPLRYTAVGNGDPLPTAAVYGAYGVGIVMPVSVVPTRENRPVRESPIAWAPTAIARATNTINMAYSVAVAPPSSRRKRRIRLSI